MENVLNLLKNISKKYQDELDEVNQKIAPLNKKKNDLEAKIAKYNDLISLELGEDTQDIIHVNENIKTNLDYEKVHDGSIKKITPIDAYKRIIVENFSDKPFREADIRMVANHEGITTREGAEISSLYSRSIFVNLKKNNFVSQVERGIYRYQKQQSLV